MFVGWAESQRALEVVQDCKDTVDGDSIEDFFQVGVYWSENGKVEKQ